MGRQREVFPCRQRSLSGCYEMEGERGAAWVFPLSASRRDKSGRYGVGASVKRVGVVTGCDKWVATRWRVSGRFVWVSRWHGGRVGMEVTGEISMLERGNALIPQGDTVNQASIWN